MMKQGGVWVKINGRVFNLFLICISMILLMTNLVCFVDVSASGPLPDPEQPTAYCHYEADGSRLWMNSLREDSESKEEHTDTRVHTAAESWTYGFPLREGPEDEVNLESPILFNTSKTVTGWFMVTFELGLATQEPSDVRIYLVANEEVIGEDTSPEYVENAGSYQFEMTLTVETVNDLSLRITWTEHPGTTTCIIDTNGASFVTLPLVPDTDGDGVPDNEDAFISDPAASVDSDGDGYPDEWNEGYGEDDSTTGLKLDEYPNDPTRWEKEDDENGGVKTESIIMVILFVIIIVIIIIVIIIARRRK
jgi:hypothetical protein